MRMSKQKLPLSKKPALRGCSSSCGSYLKSFLQIWEEVTSGGVLSFLESLVQRPDLRSRARPRSKLLAITTIPITFSNYAWVGKAYGPTFDMWKPTQVLTM